MVEILVASSNKRVNLTVASVTPVRRIRGGHARTLRAAFSHTTGSGVESGYRLMRRT